MKDKAQFSELGIMLLNNFGSDADLLKLRLVRDSDNTRSVVLDTDYPDISIPISIHENIKLLSINIKKTDTAILRTFLRSTIYDEDSWAELNYDKLKLIHCFEPYFRYMRQLRFCLLNFD
jgi:hypothetical protein